jgi:hypothetical protein
MLMREPGARASAGEQNKREGRTLAGIFAHLHNNRLC